MRFERWLLRDELRPLSRHDFLPAAEAEAEKSEYRRSWRCSARVPRDVFTGARRPRAQQALGRAFGAGVQAAAGRGPQLVPCGERRGRGHPAMRARSSTLPQRRPCAAICYPKGLRVGEAIRWRNDLIVAVAQVHAAMTTRAPGDAGGAQPLRLPGTLPAQPDRRGDPALAADDRALRHRGPCCSRPCASCRPSSASGTPRHHLRASWLNAQERALRYALGLSEQAAARMVCANGM